jgi:hypothetical protein
MVSYSMLLSSIHQFTFIHDYFLTKATLPSFSSCDCLRQSLVFPFFRICVLCTHLLITFGMKDSIGSDWLLVWPLSLVRVEVKTRIRPKQNEPLVRRRFYLTFVSLLDVKNPVIQKVRIHEHMNNKGRGQVCDSIVQRFHTGCSYLNISSSLFTISFWPKLHCHTIDFFF